MPEKQSDQPDRRSAIMTLQGWLLPKRIWQVVTISVRRKRVASVLVGGGLLVCIIVAVVFAFCLFRFGKATQTHTAALTLAKLDAGAFDEAKVLAIKLHRNESSSYEDISVAAFVMGAATVNEVADEGAWNPEMRKRLFLIATGYLGEAQQHGFPPLQQGQGRYFLGTSLFHSGQYSHSLPVLKEALTDNPIRPRTMESAVELAQHVVDLDGSFRPCRFGLRDEGTLPKPNPDVGE